MIKEDTTVPRYGRGEGLERCSQRQRHLGDSKVNITLRGGREQGRARRPGGQTVTSIARGLNFIGRSCRGRGSPAPGLGS